MKQKKLHILVKRKWNTFVSRHRENKRGKGILGKSGRTSSDDVGFKLEFCTKVHGPSPYFALCQYRQVL